ncbi:MAG: YggT family protein [Gemmatimonadota bacterium]
MSAAAAVYLAARSIIVATLAYALVVAGTHWAVRRRSLNAFGGWPRFVRRISDPVLQPVERRLLRSGGNPQDAPLWLLGLVVLAGLLVLWAIGWLLQALATLTVLGHSGPGAWIYTLARVAFTVLEVALIVRVIASWVGWSGRIVRLAYSLTDWLIRPLRRVLPSFGPFDFSPMVAWLLLSWILEPVVLRLIAGLITTP